MPVIRSSRLYLCYYRIWCVMPWLLVVGGQVRGSRVCVRDSSFPHPGRIACCSIHYILFWPHETTLLYSRFTIFSDSWVCHLRMEASRIWDETAVVWFSVQSCVGPRNNSIVFNERDSDSVKLLEVLTTIAIPVPASSKSWVCGRPLSLIAFRILPGL